MIAFLVTHVRSQTAYSRPQPRRQQRREACPREHSICRALLSQDHCCPCKVQSKTPLVLRSSSHAKFSQVSEVSDKAIALQDGSQLRAASSNRIKAGRLGIQIWDLSQPSGIHSAQNTAANQNNQIGPNCHHSPEYICLFTSPCPLPDTYISLNFFLSNIRV